MNEIPRFEEGEISILSSMMQSSDGSVVNEAIELGITEESFLPSHRKIFKYLLSCVNKGMPIDLISITDYFKNIGELENIGGPGELTNIYSFAVTNAYFKKHCKDVIDRTVRRKLIAKCESIIKNCEEYEDLDPLLDNAENSILSIRLNNKKDDIATSDSLISTTIDNLEKFIRGDKSIQGLPTRFSVLNDLSKGFMPGNIIIIAARPSMGKTALMCNMVEDLTVDDHAGIIFSCEMSKEQLMERMVFGRAKLPSHYLRHGFSPTNEELEGIRNSVRDLSKRKLFIDDTPAIHIDDLRAKARRKKKEEDISYFAVDYLQLMRGYDRKNREREISEISSGLKALSKELKIPGIILAQINRNAERRQDGIPKMSDLRESGAIEQDADLIGLLYRPDYYKDETEEDQKRKNNPFERSKQKDFTHSKATLIIAKNRNGPTGEVEMTWTKEIMQFS